MKINNTFTVLQDKNRANSAQKRDFLRNFKIHKRNNSETKYAIRIKKADNDAKNINTINRFINENEEINKKIQDYIKSQKKQESST